ncbi:hypothetical protein IFM89_024776 [Coptis chinensis]|uniref:BZIP domain-containing protein n=1 Tax=Coptis chinensis TaxID=261450 RepID=A0A835LSQ6_9MAGN|nr:hypothetical protein IFM89_024776 [Coptis chinensis]
MHSHPVPQPLPGVPNSLLDTDCPENQLTISSPLIGTLSDTHAPGRKRGASREMIEKTVERRQKRMIKNRESATRSPYTNELENKVSRLEEENARLKKQQASSYLQHCIRDRLCYREIDAQFNTLATASLSLHIEYLMEWRDLSSNDLIGPVPKLKVPILCTMQAYTQCSSHSSVNITSLVEPNMLGLMCLSGSSLSTAPVARDAEYKDEDGGDSPDNGDGGEGGGLPETGVRGAGNGEPAGIVGGVGEVVGGVGDGAAVGGGGEAEGGVVVGGEEVELGDRAGGDGGVVGAGEAPGITVT